MRLSPVDFMDKENDCSVSPPGAPTSPAVSPSLDVSPPIPSIRSPQMSTGSRVKFYMEENSSQDSGVCLTDRVRTGPRRSKWLKQVWSPYREPWPCLSRSLSLYIYMCVFPCRKRIPMMSSTLWPLKACPGVTRWWKSSARTPAPPSSTPPSRQAPSPPAAGPQPPAW